MVTIHSLHLLYVGIYFLIASQITPFQEMILSSMMIIGVILVVLGVLSRIVKTIGLKLKQRVKAEENSKQKSFPKNYYFSYFLISLAIIFTIGGVMTMSSTDNFIENYSPDYLGIFGNDDLSQRAHGWDGPVVKINIVRIN